MRFPLDNYTVTQGFYPVAVPGHPFHGGLDLAAPKGTPILSPVTGTVINVGTDVNYEGGLYVIVREDDPEHLEYYMGHQSQTEVVKGQYVPEGQEIGKVGATGNATGPHVHFQIREENAGALQDPNEVLKRKGGDNMPTKIDEGNLAFYTDSMVNTPPVPSDRSLLGMDDIPAMTILKKDIRRTTLITNNDNWVKVSQSLPGMTPQQVIDAVNSGGGEFEPVDGVYKKKGTDL